MSIWSSIIQLPSGNAWNIIKDVWTTDSDLDTTKILQFLSKHAHQMDDKLGKVGCSQNHCHWCAATNAVCEVCLCPYIPLYVCGFIRVV
jgi:hypothetical protein